MATGKCSTLESVQSHNPATGELVWEAPATSPEQVDQAVRAARSAFPSWSALSFEKRKQYVLRFGELLETHAEDLAQVISLEMGKVLWESRGEVAAMRGKIPISIQAHLERCPEKSLETPAATAVLRHRPHGVVAVFGPFNFPGHLPNGHIVPALLAGNTVVFKPSERTSWTGHKMVELWREAGLPDGVLNQVQGGSGVGKALANHPQIDGLFFTGSSRTGCLLSETFGKQPEKILALEMGGNNPLIAWEIEDVQAAAYQIVQSAFITSGQRCTCARRLFLSDGEEGDLILKALLKMIDGIQVGPYDQSPPPFMGPVVSAADAKHLLQAQEDLVAKGAKPLRKMTLLKTGTGLLTPGLLDSTQASDLPDEEFFGPLLQVFRVPSLDRAIQLANATRYGLAAGILTKHQEYYHRVLHEVRAGIINWNTQTTGASSAAPFGGAGISGNHRPSAYYAADYCSYPVASMEVQELKLPAKPAPGIKMESADS